MKLGLISDIHYDTYENLTKEDFFENIKQLVTENSLDTLVIGGDISNSHKTTFPFVEELQAQLNIPVYFVPGNHDYWEKNLVHKDSMKVYQNYVDHPQSLLESPVILSDKYALVGHSAWYNHAIHGQQFTEEELDKGIYGERTWQDKLNARWGMTDRELSKHFADLVKKDLEKVGDRDVVLVTHMVTIPDFTVPMPHEPFDFFNAFIATDDFDDIHRDYPIKYSSMGHVHYRGTVERDGITYICNCLGYQREWRSDDFQKELQASLFVLELE